jgi:flagellar assembly protein FliH
MSSKIIRRGDVPHSEAHAIEWRTHGQTQRPSTGTSSVGLARQGTGNGETRTEDPEQLKALRAAAYQQGFVAGEAAGAQRAQTRLEPVLTSFSSIVTELAGTRKKLRGEAEEAAVALALEVARRILHREVASDPEAILGLVKAAFQKCDARATQRLRVSPQDAQAIRENLARLHLPPGLELVEDRNLARGSAIFETARGDLDVSVDTQLAEIERGFADVLKRRHP